MDNNQEPDFLGALQAEFGITPDPVTPPDSNVTTPPDDGAITPPDEKKNDLPDEPVTPPVEDSKTQPDVSTTTPDDGAKQETAEEKANREATSATTEAAKTPEAPQYATAEDVKNAIREVNNESSARVDKIYSARQQIIDILHPEGIDRNIYDTNGRVIKTAQDIVDRGLINERTNEPYTYEEAASFILEANRKMTENINELNSWAETVAEQNISLAEGNERVMSKWGDILKAMPQLAKKLADTYITTQLEFDKTGNYITKMSMEPERFYDLTLTPYKELGQALIAKQKLEAAEAARIQAEEAKQQQDAQNERNGLPPQRGTAEMKANTGDPMLDALVDELNKG